MGGGLAAMLAVGTVIAGGRAGLGCVRLTVGEICDRRGSSAQYDSSSSSSVLATEGWDARRVGGVAIIGVGCALDVRDIDASFGDAASDTVVASVETDDEGDRSDDDEALAGSAAWLGMRDKVGLDALEPRRLDVRAS